MELFFDTETTGLPLFKEPATHPKQPDVIQLAAILSTEDEIVETLNYIINPDDINPGWTINPFAAAAHGISEEKIRAEGVSTLKAIDHLLELASKADLLVCHNVSFDQKLVEGAMHKASYQYDDIMLISNGTYYCTMKKSTSMCGLKKKNGTIKWPKLDELYQILFDCSFEDQHDALADVMATRRCYYELIRRGI